MMTVLGSAKSLNPRGNVRRLAQRELFRCAAADLADDDQAGVNADADLERLSPSPVPRCA